LRAHAFPFGWCDPRRDVGIAVGVAAQPVAQRVCIRDGAANDAQVGIVRGRMAGRDERQALAREAAAAQYQFPPLLAAFPVAVVGRVVTEAKEDREGKPHQRERRRREMQLVVAELAVGPGADHRQQRTDREVHPDARQDRTAHDEEQPQGRWAVADDHVRLQARSSMVCMRSMVVHSGLRTRKLPIHISHVRHERCECLHDHKPVVCRRRRETAIVTPIDRTGDHHEDTSAGQ
jgi:hypothetical protein